MEWVAISFSNAWKWKVKVKSLSRARLLATPWTAAHQAPPSMGFSRQEHWSGVPTAKCIIPFMWHFRKDICNLYCLEADQWLPDAKGRKEWTKRETFSSSGTVLQLDCGGSYTSVYICQNLNNVYLKWAYFIIHRLYIKEAKYLLHKQY